MWHFIKWLIVFILVCGGIGFPPLWILALIVALQDVEDEEKQRHERAERELAKRPCPRCSNEWCQLYNKGSWSYFTCGGCGARGYYPFQTRVEINQRLHRF